MRDSENQVMLTFCLRVTPIVCRRFQYLEMGKWKWVQQKVMDKIFNRNYVSVIIIINFINLRYLWTIPWTSLLLLSSRIFATSPRNSTSLAWSYHCCQHCHCQITLSPHLPVLPLPWFSGNIFFMLFSASAVIGLSTSLFWPDTWLALWPTAAEPFCLEPLIQHLRQRDWKKIWRCQPGPPMFHCAEPSSPRQSR